MKNREGTFKKLLRIPNHLKCELDNLAEDDGRSLNNFIIKILTEYVENCKKNNPIDKSN